jgi:hypothetical protein
MRRLYELQDQTEYFARKFKNCFVISAPIGGEKNVLDISRNEEITV